MDECVWTSVHKPTMILNRSHLRASTAAAAGEPPVDGPHSEDAMDGEVSEEDISTMHEASSGLGGSSGASCVLAIEN